MAKKVTERPCQRSRAKPYPLQERLRRHPDPAQPGVHDPELRVEHEAGQDAGSGGRGDERHEDAGPVEAGQPDRLVQRDRHQQAEEHRAWHETAR
jgi:hypothetical protein